MIPFNIAHIKNCHSGQRGNRCSQIIPTVIVYIEQNCPCPIVSMSCRVNRSAHILDACPIYSTVHRANRPCSCSKEKPRDKIENMIALYKRWRDKANKNRMGRECNRTWPGRGQWFNNTRDFDLECSYYYEFEEIMGTSRILRHLIAELGHPDSVTTGVAPLLEVYHPWMTWP